MCSIEGLDRSPDAVAVRSSHQRSALPWSWPEAARALLAVLAIAAAIGLMAGRTGRRRAARSELEARELKVDPSTATAEVLETLPAIGPTLARRIIEAQAEGPFRSPEDLRARVRGIGPATLARIEPYLRFDGATEIRPRPDRPTIVVVDAAATSRKPPRSRSRKAKGSSVQLAAKTRTDASTPP